MPNATTLPVMAALSILGTALGVNLGRAAISEIDPAYFSDPEAPFHANLAANRTPDGAQLQAAALQQAASGPEVMSCVGCTGYPAQGAVVYAAVSDGFEDGWAASAAAARREDAAVEVIAPPARDPELDRIERYASYAVSAEEAAAQAEAPEEQGELAGAGTD